MDPLHTREKPLIGFPSVERKLPADMGLVAEGTAKGGSDGPPAAQGLCGFDARCTPQAAEGHSELPPRRRDPRPELSLIQARDWRGRLESGYGFLSL